MTFICPSCGKRATGKNLLECDSCQKPLRFVTEDFKESGSLSQCPICGCPHIYRQKDFNRKIGATLLILGIMGAYFTYGLSLLAVTLLDWLLYRWVADVGCCYQCGAQFRHPSIEKLSLFNLGLRDHYRNITAMKSRVVSQKTVGRPAPVLPSRDE